jgi:hypothetical protein
MPFSFFYNNYNGYLAIDQELTMGINTHYNHFTHTNKFFGELAPYFLKVSNRITKRIIKIWKKRLRFLLTQ